MTTAELIASLQRIDPLGTMQVVMIGGAPTTAIEVMGALAGELTSVYDSIAGEVVIGDNHPVVTITAA